jgi:hypothetical protein
MKWNSLQDALGESSQTYTDRPILLVVCIPERKMALVEEDRAFKIYRVAAGAKDCPLHKGHWWSGVRASQLSFAGWNGSWSFLQ